MFRFDRVSLVLLLLTGCGTHSEIDAGGKLDGALDDAAADADAADDASDADADHEDTQTPDPRHPITPCGSVVLECGDGFDNDGDGLIDSDDPDCAGPCDNNEEGYFARVPVTGERSPCQFDCYFDGDRFSGGSDCLWDLRCDPASPGEEWPGNISCAYDSEFTGIDCSHHFDAQYDARPLCQENCEWRTPNGCDCFGCCAFPTGTKPDRHILLGSKVPGTTNQHACDHEEATKDDSDVCAECTPVPSCYKECGRCELCLGKLTLPEDCTEEEVTGRCGSERQVCGLPGDEPCDEGSYCLSGCCLHYAFPG